MELLERHGLDGIIVGVVEKETYVHEAKQPSIRRSANMVYNGADYSLIGLIPPFCWVLVLLLWFTLPRLDEKRLKDVLDFATDF